MAHTSPNSLRPEARSFGWHDLHESQQHAFKEIARALATAVNAMDRRVDSETSQRSDSIDMHRNNQTILLTADRGMGKTSLLLSLQDAVRSKSAWKIGDTKQDQEVLEAMEILRDRVVWLETLDMEPLPEPTNLLVAILARIERAVTQWISVPKGTHGLLSPAIGVDKDLLELRRLTTDASLAWDGNTRERATSLDPDAFASEVMRAEMSRLSFNPRLHDVLERLAQNIPWRNSRSPLFILPIDDFDLNPIRCLELLRLIRSMTVPRLFTLILGDFQLAEMVFRLKMAGDFARVGGVRMEADGLFQTDIFRQTEALSSNALRKLLPPGQRVELRAMTVEESLAYKPSREARSLLEVLSKVGLDLELPLASPRPETGERTVNNLADFLLIPAMVSMPGSSTYVYSASKLLEVPPREIADLWFMLQRSDARKTSDRSRMISSARQW